MLLRLLLSVLVLLGAESFLIHPAYNIDLEESLDIKVDDFVKEEDYEMIGDDVAAPFRIDDKENKLGMLHKLASKWYDTTRRERRASRRTARVWFRGTPPAPPPVTDTDEYLRTGYATTPSIPHKKSGRRQSRSDSPDSYEYDYTSFMTEYYDESVQESQTNKTFNATVAKQEPGVVKDAKAIVSLDMKTRNCTEEELKHIGLKALNCIVQDYRSEKQPGVVLARRLWRICKIWFMVYVVIAVPLWCTRGWCCCCLYCKFFKPRRTIDSAKSYLMRNPPGVMYHSDGTEMKYTATDYEVESYEELEHFIRTM